MESNCASGMFDLLLMTSANMWLTDWGELWLAVWIKYTE